MATYAAAGPGESVSIGRVISRAASALASNPGTMFGVALVVGGLPQLALKYASQTFMISQPLLLRANRWELVTSVSAVSALLGLVLSMLVQGALVRATFAAAQGRKASFGESVAAGLSVALPLVGLAILAGIGIFLGFVLFFVPGVMLAMAWAVVAPALVEEKLGVFEAFGRSRALTRGARWKIFGLVLLLWVGCTLLLSVFGVTLVAGGVRNMIALTASGPTFAWFVFTLLQTTVIAAIWAALQTALYIELRDWKDGPTTDALAEIFA